MYNYTELTFTELVNKIGSSRYWNLPSMLKEILSRLSGAIFNDAPIDGEQYGRQDGEWTVVESASRPYKVYTALLSQSGTDAPVATVLENTLGGDVVWSYVGIGGYSATSLSLFTENKTTALIGSGMNGGDSSSSSLCDMHVVDIDTVEIKTFANSNNAIAAENVLTNTTIEIRVYN